MSRSLRLPTFLGIALIAILAAVILLALTTVAFNSRPALANGSILVYTGNSPFSSAYTEFGNAAGKTIVTNVNLPADLSPFDCVVLPANQTAFDTNQKATLSGYINGGGRIVAQADNNAFPAAIATMNDLAAALGSGLSVVPALIDTGFNTTTNIDSSSFTVGVSSIRYAATSEVAVSGAAESLVRTKGGTTFIGADSIGSGVFFLLGDFNVLSDQSDSGYIIQDNGALAANMCGGPSTTPTPTSTSTPTSTPTPAVPAATATPAPTATATPTAPTAAPAVLAATATPAPTATAVLGVTQLPSTGGEPAGGSSALAWLALAIGALIVTSGGLALAYQRRRVR